MSFSQATITEVFPPKPVMGGLQITWTSSSPVGTVFQVYVNRALAWSGTDRSKVLQIPENASIDIGTVGFGEASTDFSADLPAIPETRVTLTWQGGLWEGSDLVGFRIYGEATAGGGIDYTHPLADMQAYAEGAVTDGYGLGGYGMGGFGSASGTYSWTSGPYTTGTWHFAVKPYDVTGNEGTAVTGSQFVQAPPGPPARFADGTRLHYTYSATTHKATLTWNASPG
ncbi:MAG: hypothetical protein KGL39_27410 [Patescibacteria group bacterium]|nr:hypothetical protein [Patescibacteria group bacterium]